MILNNKYYVYAHINITTNIIFYVGKGFGNRDISKRGRSKYWHRIVDKYGYDVIRLEDELSNLDSLEKEIYWINRIGRKINNGTLINMTNGGDGGDTISIHPNRAEIILKISNANKGIKSSNYGGKLINDEWLLKQKISNSKVHLKITDTITGKVLTFLNSKDAAKHFNCSPSAIRENKKHNWLLKRRFKIENNN